MAVDDGDHSTKWSSMLTDQQITRCRAVFDPAFYMRNNPDVQQAAIDPFEHYMSVGWSEKRDPHPDFSTSFYLEVYADVLSSGLNPFVHWVLHGLAEKRVGTAGPMNAAAIMIMKKYPMLSVSESIKVASSFDEKFYRRQNPDVVLAGIPPLAHFLHNGYSEMRDPSPLFSISTYLSVNQSLWHKIANPFIYWILSDLQPARIAVVSYGQDGIRYGDTNQVFSRGQVKRLKEHFKADYYITRYLDDSFDDEEAFAHFMGGGWKSFKNPSESFSVKHYLQTYTDLLKEKVNPLWHWVEFGRKEGRRTLPFYADLARQKSNFSTSVLLPVVSDLHKTKTKLFSIFQQSYKVSQVILLVGPTEEDERSALTLMEEYGQVVTCLYCRGAEHPVDLMRRSLELATGDIAWMAWSNNITSANFVEKLIPYFRDQSVKLAIGTKVSSFDDFKDKDGASRSDAVVRPAALWFSIEVGLEKLLGHTNDFLWRRHAINNTTWENAKASGGLFARYLSIFMAGGGQIAFEPEAISASAFLNSDTGFMHSHLPTSSKEYEILFAEIQTHWDVSATTLVEVQNKLQAGDVQIDSDALADLVRDKGRAASSRAKPHLLITFLDFTPGGGELFPIILANALYNEGFNISTLCFEIGGMNPDMRSLLDHSIPVYDAVWVDEYGADRFLLDAGISLVHSHTIGSESRFFDVWDIQTNIPYLVTLHGSYESTEISFAEMQKITKRVSRFVYTAEKNLAPFTTLQIPKDRFSKLPNAMPIDFRDFPKTRQQLGIADDAVVFTLVARGVPQKGWQAVIASFLKLRAAHPSRATHLLLCGGGEETDRTFRIYGSEPAITFLGYQFCVHGLYRMSDVCLVPSRFAGESYPLCIIQALQSGTPVIGTRIGEIEAMIISEDLSAGVIIEPHENDVVFEKSLLDAMMVMLDAESRSDFAKAACILGKNYDIKELANRYLQIYTELLGAAASVSAPLTVI